MQVRDILSLVAVGALLAACGSSTTGNTATMNVRLVDAPSSGFQEVNVDVRTVEINGDGGWIVLGTPNRVVNLLALTGGVAETLVDGATLPAGHYGQMRLVLGPDNTVKLLDGAIEPLKVPSGQQSGVKLTVNFDVQAGTTADVFIDFDAHKSVFVHEAGNSGKYLLRPTVRAYDKMMTGSISGTFTVAGSLVALPDAVVTAQTVGAAGPVISRSTRTDAAGHYVLDLLPLGAAYHVVSQPVAFDSAGAPTASYEARASGPIAITAASPTGTFDAAFSLAAVTGGIAGTVLPAAVDPVVDMVQARLPLLAGAATQTLIVRTVPADVSTSGETYALPALPVTPPGTSYAVVVERRGYDSAGNGTVTYSTPVDVTVAPGARSSLNLTGP
jgi:Domain of unknown function (DUF4382)